MEKNFSSILVGFGVVFLGSFSVLAQQVAAPGLGVWSRAGQGCSGVVGCCMVQVRFRVNCPLPRAGRVILSCVPFAGLGAVPGAGTS